VNAIEVRSTLGRLQMFTFGFGATVGIAWVVLMGQLLAQAGFAGALLGLTIGAAMMATIALCYAQIGARYPLAGGEVAYVREIYGLRASYLLGWFLLLSCVLVCSFEMISVGWLISQLWPELVRTRLYSVLGADVYLEPWSASMAVQFVIAAVNYRGNRDTGRLQAFATGGKILLSGCFIVAALHVARLSHSRPYFVSDRTGSVLPGVISVITVAPFWFSGFNAVAQTLGERSAGVSARAAANLIISSLGAAWLFYCLVLVSMTLVMPREELLSHSLPTAAAFQAAFNSETIGKVVLFAALLGLISTWNALFFSATRILAVLSKDGFVGSRFSMPNARFGTPTLSIVVIGVAIPICALLGKGVIGPLLSLFSVVVAGIYATVCFGVIVLRRNRSTRVTTASLALPYLALSSCLVIAVFGMTDPIEAWLRGRLPIEMIVLIGWAACGLLMAYAHDGKTRRANGA
jgi:APA family basic amino acid/polyamine antiporter